MTTIRRLGVTGVILVAAMALSTAAAAQTNDETFQTMQWSFSTPGARAIGMGKTFIGKADDASAAVTNPAGLMSLTRPQVYGEFKATTVNSERLSAADSLITHQPTTTTNDINSFSFVSISVPIKSRLAVGFSVHRFLDYVETYSLAARSIPNNTNAFFPVTGTVKFGANSFGASVAFMVTNSFRVGATVAADRLEADALSKRYSFDKTIVRNETSINDSQSGTSFTLGGLYRSTSDKVSVGFSYHKSPRFNTQANLRINSANTSANVLTNAPGFPKDVEINVPDRFGFGVALRPASKLLVAVDVVRTKYSSLSENMTIVFSPETVRSTDYDTPDTTEVHVGAEFIAGSLMGKPLFLRGGVFTNPNHVTSYVGNDVAEKAFYSLPHKDDTRGTVGAGIVLGSRVQLDLAYVFDRELVASTAIRF